MDRLPRFKCPKCGQYTFGSVLDTRPMDNAIERKRECENCGVRFITEETFKRYPKTRKGRWNNDKA